MPNELKIYDIKTAWSTFPASGGKRGNIWCGIADVWY